MELTKDEMESIAPGQGLIRVNVFPGPAITDTQDPAQRKLVLDEMRKSLAEIEAGNFEEVTDFED